MIFLRTFLLFLLILPLSMSSPNAKTFNNEGNLLQVENEFLISKLYDNARLKDEGLSYDAFKKGMIAYLNLINDKKIKNTRVLSILDFNQPSTSKRFYIIDVTTGKLLLKTYVSHGRNSGLLYAERFSNIVNSKQSSLGIYKTSETYHGKYGLSLKLDGLEKNINDNARKRAVVLHPAKYVSEHFIDQNGYIGRSFGCPAVPYKDHKDVIQYIKGESAFYIHTAIERRLDEALFTMPDNALELLAKYTNIPPQTIKVRG
ncbi:murein L,D-transpeptidase catalytic domain family protein [Flammeovirga aprica]|uniref:Murein L,D-transpeptidase catalytic domain family protein n=1 Tax=Flammeovirga aprica JL-4 TaxID=694437 RepID=A0A7X9RRZ7_9BACT|nr:murein L,D-transpeptidase catalytic domain family protein [Flammeovirga aprica]NME66690.1 murein L,D-transpeptidase catalytic domain family protein [Flammeovirga aprica JL-4]